jgi:dTDP-4-dehydrorhamnose 3,5-epimerase
VGDDDDCEGFGHRHARRGYPSGHMKTFPTRLAGLVHLMPTVHGDPRGFFVETLRREQLESIGVTTDFVQHNHSRSTHGVLRGMHFSVGDGQAKLVRCARGRILDVVVDIRHGSPTFGEWEGFALDDVDHAQLFVPVGFAHGFIVLSDVADVIYLCSNYYDGTVERGFAWNDPDVSIAWPGVPIQVSERDQSAPSLRDLAPEIPFRWSSA